ncbi:hypothetical protein [Metabacillus litoralis]|uniref:hypothetical protein n=1 Tax=Metabacillus litoralis TaxID=152268 RepID=UPI001315629E|nr:hypothetical protein [Metabacillus litoralis]
MLNLWLVTISLGGFLVVSIGLVLFALQGAVNSEDSYRVDPIPTDDDVEDKK